MMPTPLPTQTNIGRGARIAVPPRGRQQHELSATVMDLVAGTNTPKRVRVDQGHPDYNGKVLLPLEYAFLGWEDEEEI